MILIFLNLFVNMEVSKIRIYIVDFVRPFGGDDEGSSRRIVFRGSYQVKGEMDLF